MSIFEEIINYISWFFFGHHTLAFILICGVYLTVRTGFAPIRMFVHLIKLFSGIYIRSIDPKIPSTFLAFCQEIAAPIGLGSIAGVAIALSLGGPGAIFWMWVFGFIGMGLNYISTTLSLEHRTYQKSQGVNKSGPITAIHNVFGGRFITLTLVFAASLLGIALFAGGAFQVNQVITVLNDATQVPKGMWGVALCILIGMYLIGKFQSLVVIGSRFAPGFVLIYALGVIGILIKYRTGIPDAFSLIIKSAFSGDSVFAAGAGLTFREILVIGVKRAIFSSEASIGTTGMRQFVEKANPVQEGIVSMTGPLIDSVIVSTMTALVILLTGVWDRSGNIAGVELVGKAFGEYYGRGGTYAFTLLVLFFALMTTIRWVNVSKKVLDQQFSTSFFPFFKLVFLLSCILGIFLSTQALIDMSDIFLAVATIINIIIALMFRKRVKKSFKQYIKDLKAGRI